VVLVTPFGTKFTPTPSFNLSGETHSCQSQQRHMALANRSKSLVLRERHSRPSIPVFLGRVVLVQFTLHLPLEVALSPVQRNHSLAIAILSISSKSSSVVFSSVRR
jgi:hypothetical protein